MSNGNDNGTARGVVGFCGLLGIAFIVLKLCGVIDWDWWVVLMPIWIPFAVICVLLMALGIAYFANRR